MQTQQIICPNVNCGYRGPVALRERSKAPVVGMLALGVVASAVLIALEPRDPTRWVLAALTLVPALLVGLCRLGCRRVCPQCGLQIGDD